MHVRLLSRPLAAYSRAFQIMSRGLTVSRDAISLTPDEEKLFQCLDAFVAHVKAERPEHASLEARIAGGWVRDKLLMQECYDCDVAIANMKGLDFAVRFVPYYQQFFGMPAEKVRIAEIKANPDQSKHLDTATVSLLGQGGGTKKIDLDFVQLRSEEYSEGSRIPTEVRFGTPLEDALRRDLTINALFYNVHTKEVEDHTDKGLVDLLQTPLIRTPLEPQQTFLDDPLRILRCIRFATRLGYPLDDSIRHAVRQTEVRDALAHKVSKERVGIEVKKMLSKPNAEKAVRMIEELGLYDIVFAPPAQAGLSAVNGSEAVAAADALRSVFSGGPADQLSRLPSELLERVHASFELYLASALAPLRHATYKDRKGRPASVVRFVASDSLKLGNEDADFVDRLFAAVQLLNSPKIERYVGPDEQAELGFMLPRISAEKGPTWRQSLFFALLLDVLPHLQQDPGRVRGTIEDYDKFVKRILELELDVRAFEKPLLNGNDAKQHGVTGPQVKAFLDEVKRWQLLHPDGSRQDCSARMKEWVQQAEPEAKKVKR